MGIEFEEEKNYSRKSRNSRITKWLIKKGIVNNVDQANVIFIVITLAFFGISIYFFTFGFSVL